MQLSIFEPVGLKENKKEVLKMRQVKKEINDNIFDWEQALRTKRYKHEQLDMVSQTVADSNITTYRSGSSSRADILGYIAAGASIGVTAIDVSRPVVSLMAEYISKGGSVFADSGAFRNYKARKKDPSVPRIDFEQVFECYYQIIDQCKNAESLIVVAPDEVGDQCRSYDLLVEWAREIKLIVSRGVRVMVPMQKGKLTVFEHYTRCRELLNMEFIVGLPSNAEAMSREEVMDFITLSKPSDVHFLGCSESALVHEAKHCSPGTEFSCDATKLRKHIGKGRLLTEMHQQIRENVLCFALDGGKHRQGPQLNEYDESELHLFSIIPELSKKELAFLSDCSRLSVEELLSAKDCSDIDILMFEKGDYHAVSMLFYPQWVSSKISPTIRTHVVSELALANII